MSSLSNALSCGLRPLHTHAQFYGPSGHDSPTTVSRTSTPRPTLSTAPIGIIDCILEFDPTSALALGVANRVFTDRARHALQSNANRICWCLVDNDIRRIILGHGRIVTNYLIAQLTEDDVQVRSRAAVIFHVTIVNQIRTMGVNSCPAVRILSCSELLLFSVRASYLSNNNQLVSLPESLFEGLSG